MSADQRMMARPSRREAQPRWGYGLPLPRQPLVERLTLVAVLVTMCVSAPLLSLLGVPYDAPDGFFLLKLHPGTWITLSALTLSLAVRGNPLRELGRSLAAQPPVAIYLGTVMAMLLYSALRYGPSGAAFFIDTLLVPGLLALLLARMGPAGLRWLPPLLVAILLTNETIGVIEQLLQHRLIPNTVLGGKLLHEDVFRATALMGHPLTNAAITGFGLFLLYRLPRPWMRIATCWLGCIALLSFGGRTALGVNVTLLVLIATVNGLRCLRAGRLSYRGLTGGGALLILLPAAVAAPIMLGGVGARIIAKLGWDESAEVRATSLTIYQHMSLDQVLFGMSPAEIATSMREIGLHLPDEAIENFWVALSVQVGVILLACFAVGFLVFLWHLGRRNSWPIRWALVGFVLIASTSNSLSAKDILLFAVVVMSFAASVMPGPSPASAACPASHRRPAPGLGRELCPSRDARLWQAERPATSPGRATLRPISS
jgi:hypothetical protein